MTKAELTAKVAQLEETLKANESSQTELTNKLLDAKKQLENINKPKITQETVDLMYEAIEETINNFDFDNPDSYEADFTIDYDNRLAIESIRFDSISELADVVCKDVLELFNVTQEDND